MALDLPMALWRPGPGYRMISTGVLGGGLGLREWVLNAQVPAAYARTDPAAHLRELAGGLGLTGPGVGLLTAARVTDLVQREDEGVHAAATVGLRVPTWAAAPPGRCDPDLAPVPGTINVIVCVPVPLADAALVNAVLTATEAKVQAVLEAGFPGTGTATDAVCIAAPDGTPGEDFTGPRSAWGARIARAVHTAVRAGADSYAATHQREDPVKFGIIYNSGNYGTDPDALIGIARHAEDCGFESFYTPEHVALYPGASVGAVSFPPDLPIADPLECLSFVAAATERILLGTGVLLLPYHQPVVLAKRLATIDLLSKGRMRLFSIGVGGLPGEAAAVGVDYATRGRRADESIDALRLLWAGDEKGVSFDGEFVRFADACSFPKPTAPLPVHIGGSSSAAARRAGRRGDGYFPGGRLTEAEYARQIELMRATARDAGRDPDALEVTRWGSTELTPDDVARHAAAGVTRLVIAPSAADPAEQRDQLSAFADRLALR